MAGKTLSHPVDFIFTQLIASIAVQRVLFLNTTCQLLAFILGQMESYSEGPVVHRVLVIASSGSSGVSHLGL